MVEKTSHFEVERGSERGFGLVFAGFFLMVAAFLFFRNGEIVYWSLLLSLAFGLAAWVYPRLLKPLNLLWFKLGMLLGAIVAPLVMIIIFFLVVTPIGMIMRVLGKDPLRLKRNTQQGTYWSDRNSDDNQCSSMKNQF
ncbi:MAG TPA: SxtJ family membrane protein [Gammaproteobacteria bacterium]